MLQQFSVIFFALAVLNGGFATAQEAISYDASGDYIKDCKYSTCVGLSALRWSKSHPFGVAVAVRMGTKPAVTDD